MNRPTAATSGIATAAGVANVAVVLALYARADYPTLESTGALGMLVLTGFVAGSVPVLVSVYTRLYSPTAVVFAALAGAVYAELTSPSPEWGELGDYIVVDGPTHIGSYANTWYLWLALALLAGVVEFAIRRGYGIGDGRLRGLPTLPLSWGELLRIVVGVAGLVGFATTLLSFRHAITPSVTELIVFVVTVAVVTVPLAALLSRGLVAPIALFALVVPYFLTLEVFATTDSPVHIMLFGPYAIVLAVVWLLEATVRSRLRGWDGGRFAGPRTDR